MTNYSHSFSQRLARIDRRAEHVARIASTDATAAPSFSPPPALLSFVLASEPIGCSVCDRTLGTLERSLGEVLGRCMECAPRDPRRLSWDEVIPRLIAS